MIVILLTKTFLKLTIVLMSGLFFMDWNAAIQQKNRWECEEERGVHLLVHGWESESLSGMVCVQLLCKIRLFID